MDKQKIQLRPISEAPKDNRWLWIVDRKAAEEAEAPEPEIPPCPQGMSFEEAWRHEGCLFFPLARG